MSESLNQRAWVKLFEKYHILQEIDEKGIFYISANQIKQEREPRLMAKFDHASDLPPIFAHNKLSILPITRGDYAIAHFDAYHTFEKMDAAISHASVPSYIQSISSTDLSSETIALNYAVAAGIIADFTEDIDIVSTVAGRMGSGIFDFTIKDVTTGTPLTIEVKKAQIEIDGAYEGVNYLSLIEAKRELSDDFLVRQLYYPYKVWKDRITKPVKPIFLVYSNSIYHLYEYRFQDPNEYSSVELVKQKKYAIEETEITTEDITRILMNIHLVAEPIGVPFPQADNFERVINLCELLNTDDYDQEHITANYHFDVRQTYYYVSAGIYLGLIQNRKQRDSFFQLTDYGRTVLKVNYKQRQLAYCEKILSHKVFNTVMTLYFEHGVVPEIPEIVSIMKESSLYNVHSDNTFRRRASTVRSWIEWIAGLVG